MIVTLNDWLPPARHDDLSWTRARLEESVSEDGPWSPIDLFDLEEDPDPANPLPRGFTTEHAEFPEGFYRLTWIDADGDESSPTEPVQYRGGLYTAVRPTLRELGNLLSARTYDGSGNKIGTFTTATSPTAESASDLIDQAADLFLLRVPTIPSGMRRQARRAVLLKAAQLVEVSYFPEQENDNQSAYKHFAAMYLEAVEALEKAIRTHSGGGRQASFGSINVVGFTGINVDNPERFGPDDYWYREDDGEWTYQLEDVEYGY